MRLDKHGNGNGLDDLYVMPDSKDEGYKIAAFLRGKGVDFQWAFADVKGSDWYQKSFVVIPFGEYLKEELENANH